MDLSDYEGPRAVRPAEREAGAKMMLSIFRPWLPSVDEAFRYWPMGLCPEVAENVFGFFHHGEPVSLILRLERDFLVGGQRLRMGFVGGVCTVAEHRGKGLAAAVLEASYERFREHGCHLVYISGGRGLYRRSGAHHLAAGQTFTVPPEKPPPLPVTVRRASEDDVPTLVHLASQRGLRFVRPASDYRVILRAEHCCGREVEFLLIVTGGLPVGCLLITTPAEHEGRAHRTVLEYAGDVHVLAGVLRILAVELGESAVLRVNTPWRDALAARLASKGYPAAVHGIGGTMKVPSFPALWRALEGWFAERCDPVFVAGLDPVAGGGRCTVWRGADGLEMDSEEAMIQTLFGSPDGGEVPGVRAIGRMVELVDTCLPVPLPAWDVNTI
ncbi:MAG: GNAT family N-acetyltransferase [Armatimonadetes bacterium]|nr:GNAT family N-acetyltransferase [Armatimonadota bacterium]